MIIRPLKHFITVSGFLLCVGLMLSCAKSDSNTVPSLESIKVFPPNEVCRYPANVSAKIFHPLGDGTWSSVSENNTNSEYRCAGATNVVQIYNPAGAAINVEYTAAGTGRGATIITLKYSGVNVTENETTYRTVFANFANDTLRQSLQESMPELMRKKILNLASFFKPGTDNEETFFIRDGFVLLTREHDQQNSSITVTLRIFPDKALKLDQAG